MLPTDQIEEKLKFVVNSETWKRFVHQFTNADRIFIVGNGGLYAIAQHGADDIVRLTGKKVLTLDSPCMLTSLANDYGYEFVFKRWLQNESCKKGDMVIGMSCSGMSDNIMAALHHAQYMDADSFLICGGNRMPQHGVNVLQLGTQHYHTTEILCLLLLYQIVYSMGYSCPQIKGHEQK